MSFHSSTNGNFITSDDTRSDTTEIIDPSGFAPSLSTPTASPHLSYGTEASTPNTASTDCSTGHISTPEALPRRTHSDGRTGRLRRLNSNDSPMVSASGFGVAASPRVPSLISNWASPAPFNGSSRAHSDSFGDSKEANFLQFALPPARSGLNPKRQTEMTNQPASPYKGQPVLPSSASNYELGRPAPAGGIANVLSAARAAVNSPPRPVNTNEPRSGLRVDPLLSTTSANSGTESFSFMSPGPRATGQGMFSPLAPRPSGFPAGRQPTAMSLPAPPAFSVPTVCEDPFAPPAPTRSPYPPSVTHNSPSSEISSLPPHSPTHSTCSHGSSCHSPHSTASILSPTMIGRKFPGAASVDAVEMQKSAVCRRHLCCSKCRRPLRRGEASSAVNSPSPHFVAAPNDYGPSDFGVPAGAYTQLPLVSHDLYVIDQKVAGMRHPSLNKHKSSPNAGVSQPLARRPSHNSLPHAGSSVSSPEADCEPEYEKPEFIRVSSQPVGPHGYEHHHGKVAHMHPHAHPHPHPSPYHAPVSLVNKLPPADLLLPPPTSEIPGSVRPAYQATIVANQAATAFMQPPQPALPHAPGTPNPGGRKSVIPLESKRPHFEPASVGVFGSPFPAAPGGPMPASAPPAVAPQTPSADEGLGAGADDAALRDLISRFRNRDFEAGGESCLPR